MLATTTHTLNIKMQGSYAKYKHELSLLERADWGKAEELVLTGHVNRAIEALLPLVPDAARAYVKAVLVHNLKFEDLIGVGNLALVEAVQKWKPEGESLKNWCYKKVGRDIGRYVGKELKYIMHTESELPLDHEDEPVDQGRAAEDVLNEEQIKEWVNKNFTPKESEIVNLVYFNNISIRDIAKQHNVSPEAISKIHRRVLKKLRGEVDTLGMSRDIL